MLILAAARLIDITTAKLRNKETKLIKRNEKKQQAHAHQKKKCKRGMKCKYQIALGL